MVQLSSSLQDCQLSRRDVAVQRLYRTVYHRYVKALKGFYRLFGLVISSKCHCNPPIVFTNSSVA